MVESAAFAGISDAELVDHLKRRLICSEGEQNAHCFLKAPVPDEQKGAHARGPSPPLRGPSGGNRVRPRSQVQAPAANAAPSLSTADEDVSGVPPEAAASEAVAAAAGDAAAGGALPPGTPKACGRPAAVSGAEDGVEVSPFFSMHTPPRSEPGTPRSSAAKPSSSAAKCLDRLFDDTEDHEGGVSPGGPPELDGIGYDLPFDLLNSLPHEKAVGVCNLLKHSERERAKAVAVAQQLQRELEQLRTSSAVSASSSPGEADAGAAGAFGRQLPITAPATAQEARRRCSWLRAAVLAAVVLVLAAGATCVLLWSSVDWWARAPQESVVATPLAAPLGVDGLPAGAVPGTAEGLQVRGAVESDSGVGGECEATGAACDSAARLPVVSERPGPTAESELSAAAAAAVGLASKAHGLDQPAGLGESVRTAAGSHVDMEVGAAEPARAPVVAEADVRAAGESPGQELPAGGEERGAAGSAGDAPAAIVLQAAPGQIAGAVEPGRVTGFPISGYRSGLSASVIGDVAWELHHHGLVLDKSAPRDASDLMGFVTGVFPGVDTAYRLGSLVIRTAFLPPDSPPLTALASLLLGNNGALQWPPSATLRLVSGADVGLLELPVGLPLAPGESVQLTLRFDLPAAPSGDFEGASATRFGWVLEAGGEPFGPLLVLEAIWF